MINKTSGWGEERVERRDKRIRRNKVKWWFEVC